MNNNNVSEMSEMKYDNNSLQTQFVFAGNDTMSSSSSSTINVNGVSTNKDGECAELKNIKYKTMLISGNLVTESKSSNDLNNLDKFLEQDTTNNQNEPWSKLDKTAKVC